MRISTERFGIKVSCQYDADISDLKKILSDASERYTDVYVPRDVSKEGNGYSFFVNHRQSLKDYVSVNGFSIDEFVGLLRRLYHFYEKCGFKKIEEHSFEDGAKSFVFVKHHHSLKKWKI